MEKKCKHQDWIYKGFFFFRLVSLHRYIMQSADPMMFYGVKAWICLVFAIALMLLFEIVLGRVEALVLSPMHSIDNAQY